MIAAMRLVLLATLVLVANAGVGLPPRPGPSDYSASQAGPEATLAATLVQTRQVQQTFNSEIAKRYLVLEVAVFPKRKVVVNHIDFSLTVGDVTVRAVHPRSVSWTERGKGPIADGPVTTTSTTGVYMEKGTDSYGQRRSRAGVYEDVAVSNDPNRAPVPPAPRQQVDVDQRISELALPDAEVLKPNAGFLFFAPSNVKLKKGDKVTLQWSVPDGGALQVEVQQK